MSQREGRMVGFRLLVGALACAVGTAVCAGGDAVGLWKEEAEKAVKPEALKNGCAAVDDPAASGGKALRIPYDKECKDWASLVINTTPFAASGKTVLTVNVKGENLLDLSNGPKLFFNLHQKNPQRRLSDSTILNGFRLKPGAYTPISVELDAGATSAESTAEIIFRWEKPPEKYDKPMAVLLDSLEVSTESSGIPRVVSVRPAKPRFTLDDDAAAEVAVSNPSSADWTGELVGVDHFGLADKEVALSKQITLKAGETRRIPVEWDHEGRLYGHEIRVELRKDGKTESAESGLFTVFDQPLWLSTGDSYDWGKDVRDMHSIFYVVPATFQESQRAVDFWRRNSPGLEYFEFFSWSPGDISDLAPAEELFIGGEGQCWYRSKALIKAQVAMLRQAGMWPVSYVNGTCWADSGYKLFARHPEWFIYDGNGEVGHYEMDVREMYRHVNDPSFDPKKYPGIFFQGCLNHALPEVQEYIAAQYIKCGKEMGFKGVRMDVRYLEVHPGERDFTGKEIAPTSAEADRISAAAVKRVKELVHREIPDFTFGYNYASPEEVQDMPLTMAERCKGGAWMLDEVICSYQEPNSPYHKWDAFAKRMASWGDHVSKLGGVYQPFDLRRNGANFTVDRLYSSIFRLIGGGRPNMGWYQNSSLPFGSMGKLSTRHAELFFGLDRSWVEDPTKLVEVKSPAPVMWKDTVFVNKAKEGPRLIVNLVNPPKTAIEENPLSEMPAPISAVEVFVKAMDGTSPKAAYLIHAEAPARGQPPALVHSPLDLKMDDKGGAAVTVPELLAWKMVVVQY